MNTKAVGIALIIVIGVVLVVMSLSKSDKAPRRVLVAEGLAVPDISLSDGSGNVWQLSANRGNVVLFNFWATWCDTCKEEMPSLQRLYDAKKDDPHFILITVPYDDDPAKAAEYLVENNYTLPLLIDLDGSAAWAFGLTGVPETYMVGKGGILRKKIIGPAGFDSPRALGYINRLLEEEGSSALPL